MTTALSLEALDLAALLCSRVCHDVISPVGAIVNGLEVLEEDKDEGMREFALDLIRKSAKSASARLQFCRLAFGAAGSAGASIDTGDAEKVARGLFADERTTLNWEGPRAFMAKNKVKLLLNLCLIASACIPRGGVMNVRHRRRGRRRQPVGRGQGPEPQARQPCRRPAGRPFGKRNGRRPRHPALFHRPGGAPCGMAVEGQRPAPKRWCSRPRPPPRTGRPADAAS